MNQKPQFDLECIFSMVTLFVLALGTGTLGAADQLKADGPGGKSDVIVDRWRAIVASYPVPQPPASGAIEILPTETPEQIKAKITKANEGAVFLIKASAPNTPTVYRRWSVTPKKNQKFYGQLGTDGKTRLITLKGSIDKSPGAEGITWTRDEGAERWSCTETGPLGRNPQFERYPKGYQRNAYGRVVVIDGNRPLNHYDDLAAVAGKEDGFFLDDANDRLYLGFKPDGKSVELMTDVDCFKAADGVEIYNLKVQHYANPIQGLPVTLGVNGRAEYLEISCNHAGAIRTASRAVIRNCLLVHNLQQAYNGNRLDGALLEGNEIAFNNTDLGKGKFTEWWESGGGKIAFSENTSIRNNYFHDNAGPGIWYDIDNGKTALPVIAEGNVCERNTTGGMWQELGYFAIFRGNYSRNNPKSAQILIAEAGASEKFVPTTAGGEVYGNVVEVASPDQSGLGFRVLTKAQRGNGPGGEYFVRNFTFHHNHVIHRIAGGKSGGKGPKAFQDQQLPYGNNHFEANTYHVPAGTGTTGKYWLWGAEMTFSQFQAVGHEARGSVIEDGLTWDDTTPPPVPPAPSVSGTATEPVLSGTTEPAAMILVFEETKLIATACADDSGNWSAKLTGLSAGSHTFQVAAADPAKNVSGYSTVTARIDK